MNRRKIMGSLGGASGCVNRCIDILDARRARPLNADDLAEILERLQTAETAIIVAAHELEKEPIT